MARISSEALEAAAECLRTLAHPQRLAIVQLLLRAPRTVGEISESLDIASHVCSGHLRLMERCGFLGREKSGRFVTYTVIESHLGQIMKCIEDRFGKQR